MKVKALVLTGYGINADKELQWSFELAGAQADILHLEELINQPDLLDDYDILGFAGGFSFGDHIASGKVFANLIKYNIYDKIKAFVAEGKLVIGICNGFQVIAKLGLLPALDDNHEQVVSLIANDNGRFENRWVTLRIDNPHSPWLKGIDFLDLPIRHGEGKFITKDAATLQKLQNNTMIALRYTTKETSTDMNQAIPYPLNPNGSVDNIAGITNKEGNVLGLMPHPEAYYTHELHPNWTEGVRNNKVGLDIFKNAVEYVKSKQ